MKIWLAIMLVVHLSVCPKGNLLMSYRHYFGAGGTTDDHDYSRNLGTGRDNQQQQHRWDNQDPQRQWTSPDPTWRNEQEHRHIESMHMRSGGNGGKGCAPTTMWVEKTVDRHMPVVINNKETRDYAVQQYITQTIISTKSIPYFVTQTDVEPEITKRTAILPQRITHTVRSTHIHSITKTEKIYNTVTAQRTQKFFKTVCPKGH